LSVGPTIFELLSQNHISGAAISAPGQTSLTFGDLLELTKSVIDTLNMAGIGRNDRVAIILPNGPVMASAFITIAAGATAAPLNPNYRTDEFRFHLLDLNVKALVVMAGDQSPAVNVAQELGIPIFPIAVQSNAAAGMFDLTTPKHGLVPASSGGPAMTGDIALVLHTSGTTSRPKIVPLSQANVCASAEHVSKFLLLTADDRCLNIMPLFHIHGLMAAVLASLAVGANVYCTSGFNAMRFFGWLDDAQPTWYTAVPTMHQAILARAERNRHIAAKSNLRFIRSSSSSLPPNVMTELEKTFRCPVIESYGMTEAAHQMSSNPLPPRARKAGSVGLPAGPEIAIMDNEGNLLPHGNIGEIAVRGPNVTHGYEANPKGNEAAFSHGWFRTGDQGQLDADGYLRITGRLKEIINRGGEKISPREVDEVLLEHPAIAQVVTFAIPDPKLGEEVGAAIVLKEGQTLDKQEVKDFASSKLASFKIPRTILFVDEIPTGATGKLVRLGLHKQFGLTEPGKAKLP